MANGATNLGEMSNPSQTLTAQEYEKLRLSLKRINVKAQRVQTSTMEELALRELFRKFAPVVDQLGPLKRQVSQDRSTLDREWRSCRFSEIPTVRGYIKKSDGIAGIEPVAQAELKAIMDTVAKLGNEINGGNWGEVDKLCIEFQDGIMDAIQECRNVTERELREIFTITENL